MSTIQKKSVITSIDLSDLDFFKDRTTEEIKTILKKLSIIIEYHSIDSCQEIFLDCLMLMPCTDWFEFKKDLDKINSLTIIRHHVDLYNLMNIMIPKSAATA